jgi:hypothetical protein
MCTFFFLPFWRFSVREFFDVVECDDVFSFATTPISMVQTCNYGGVVRCTFDASVLLCVVLCCCPRSNLDFASNWLTVLLSHGTQYLSSQHTYDVTSFGIDAVDLILTDAPYAGTVYNYRVLVANAANLADCAALATTGWGATLNWVIPSTPSGWCCSATGIVCSDPDGRVIEIDLRYRQLTGMCDDPTQNIVC